MRDCRREAAPCLRVLEDHSALRTVGNDLASAIVDLEAVERSVSTGAETHPAIGNLTGKHLSSRQRGERAAEFPRNFQLQSPVIDGDSRARVVGDDVRAGVGLQGFGKLILWRVHRGRLIWRRRGDRGGWSKRFGMCRWLRCRMLFRGGRSIEDQKNSALIGVQVGFNQDAGIGFCDWLCLPRSGRNNGWPPDWDEDGVLPGVSNGQRDTIQSQCGKDCTRDQSQGARLRTRQRREEGGCSLCWYRRRFFPVRGTQRPLSYERNQCIDEKRQRHRARLGTVEDR